jgi:hypothetical protein
MTGAPSSSFTLLGSTTGWIFVERDGDAEEGTAAKAAFKSLIGTTRDVPSRSCSSTVVGPTSLLARRLD